MALRRTDAVVSVAIGLVAGLLMWLIGRTLALPRGLTSILPWLPLGFPFFTLAVMFVGAVAGVRFAVAHQLAKFLLVGGLSFLIDLGMLNLLIAATGIVSGFYASVFKAVAFLAAMASSFLWNKFWTFAMRTAAETGMQFVGFFAVTLVGFLINVGTFSLLVNVLGPIGGLDLKTWASASALAAAVAGLAWNFLGYKFVVFRGPQR